MLTSISYGPIADGLAVGDERRGEQFFSLAARDHSPYRPGMPKPWLLRPSLNSVRWTEAAPEGLGRSRGVAS